MARMKDPMENRKPRFEVGDIVQVYKIVGSSTNYPGYKELMASIGKRSVVLSIEKDISGHGYRYVLNRMPAYLFFERELGYDILYKLKLLEKER